jgi:tetratricopeptide (TPR) repeat protein
LLILNLGCIGGQELLRPKREKAGAVKSVFPNRRAIEHYLKGLAFEEDGFYQGALIEYLRASRFDPGSMELHLSTARCYYILNVSDSAYTEAKRALAKSPQSEEALAIISQVHLDRKEWKEALNYLSEMEKIAPSDYLITSRIAGIYLRLKQPEDALNKFRKYAETISDSAQNKNFWNGAAALFSNYYFSDYAIFIYKELTKTYPLDDELQYDIGSEFLRQHNPDSALFYYRQAVELNVFNSQYYLSIGYLLNAENNLLSAEDTLRKGLDLAPDEAQLHDMLGVVMYRQKRYSEALQEHYRALELDPKSVSACINIAFIYDELDSLEQAIAIYDKALGIDSTNATVLNNYAYILSEANIRLQDAVQMSFKSLEKEPNNPSYLDTIGWLYYRLKDYIKAEEYIRRALEKLPSEILYLHLGDVLREKGEMEKARDAYLKGLEIAPEDKELKARLESI